MAQFQLGLNTSTIRPAGVRWIKLEIAAPKQATQRLSCGMTNLTVHEEQGGSLSDVKKALDDYGLSVPTVIALHGWLNTTGTEHQEAIEEAKRRMAQAAACRLDLYYLKPTSARFADLQLGR